jgi:hypothetical protein
MILTGFIFARTSLADVLIIGLAMIASIISLSDSSRALMAFFFSMAPGGYREREDREA